MPLDEQQFQAVLETLTRIADGLNRLAQTTQADTKITEDVQDAATLAGAGAPEEALLGVGKGETARTALGAAAILRRTAGVLTPGLLAEPSRIAGQEFRGTVMDPYQMTLQYARQLAEAGVDQATIRRLTEEYYKRVQTWKRHELVAIEEVERRFSPLPTPLVDFLHGLGHAGTNLVRRTKKYYDDLQKNWYLQGD